MARRDSFVSSKVLCPLKKKHFAWPTDMLHYTRKAFESHITSGMSIFEKQKIEPRRKKTKKTCFDWKVTEKFGRKKKKKKEENKYWNLKGNGIAGVLEC